MTCPKSLNQAEPQSTSLSQEPGSYFLHSLPILECREPRFSCLGPPGFCPFRVLIQSRSLPHVLLLTVHMGPEKPWQLCSLGKFPFPSHLVGSVFMAAFCPRESRYDSEHLKKVTTYTCLGRARQGISVWEDGSFGSSG